MLDYSIFLCTLDSPSSLFFCAQFQLLYLGLCQYLKRAPIFIINHYIFIFSLFSSVIFIVPPPIKFHTSGTNPFPLFRTRLVLFTDEAGKKQPKKISWLIFTSGLISMLLRL